MLKNAYSVPSRLIGEWVEAIVGLEEIEGLYAGETVQRMPRLRGSGKHRIDWRHMSDWLARKRSRRGMLAEASLGRTAGLADWGTRGSAQRG